MLTDILSNTTPMMVARAITALVPTDGSAPHIVSVMLVTNYGPKGLPLSGLLDFHFPVKWLSCQTRWLSSNLNEVIRPVLNFLFLFTIRFHKYKKALKSIKKHLSGKK